MSRRIDRSWLVFVSIEDEAHERCVDLFERPDGTCGFEAFRRDAEDAGVWTPTDFFSATVLPTRRSALEAAMVAVPRLAAVVERYPSAMRILRDGAPE